MINNKQQSSGIQTPERSKFEESDFLKLKLIGRGGFSDVFLVQQKTSINRKLYAMKKISKIKVTDSGVSEKMMEERKLMSSINHPNIIRLFCSFQSETHFFLISEFAQGGDLVNHVFCLSDFAPEEYGFSEERSRFYIAQIYLALRYLHDKNIIFRDLKLMNILLDSDGNIKLCDFGLSKQFITSDTSTKERDSLRTNTICGTTEFMPPELISRGVFIRKGKLESVEPYSTNVDWWSFGLVASYLLLGENPCMGEYQEFMSLNPGFELPQAEPVSAECEERVFVDVTKLGVDGNGIILSKYVDSCKELKIPFYSSVRVVSDEAIDFITKLLCFDPEKRMGYNSEDEIQNHPFFSNFGYDEKKFKDLLENRIEAPMIPGLKDDIDLAYFGEEYRNFELDPSDDCNDDNTSTEEEKEKYNPFHGFAWCAEEEFSDNSVVVEVIEDPHPDIDSKLSQERVSMKKRVVVKKKLTVVPNRRKILRKNVQIEMKEKKKWSLIDFFLCTGSMC